MTMLGSLPPATQLLAATYQYFQGNIFFLLSAFQQQGTYHIGRCLVHRKMQ